MYISSRLDKKCGLSGIANNKKCSKPTQSAQPITSASSNGSQLSISTILSVTGLTAVGGILGVLAHDTFTSGVPPEKVPPKKPPDGLYDSFKPGDLIYQTNDFGGAARAHYAVYLGKVDGQHRVFDTSLMDRKGRSASVLKIRSIEEATDTGTSFALASRVDSKGKRPTTKQLHKIVKQLNGKSFDWTGFESNCETLARSIVNDLPISTQTKNVSALSVQVTKAIVSALAPPSYRRNAVKQQNVLNLVRRTMTDEFMLSAFRYDKKCGSSGIPDNAKCHKGGSWPSAAAIATGLTAGGIAAYALSQHGSRPEAQSTSNPWDEPFTPRPPGPTPPPSAPRPPAALPGDRTTRQITGLTPKALLPPGRPPKSKTQRMRENTAAAVQGAERAIGRAAEAEITRAGAVANAMAAAGEATGMAFKTTAREVRLRTEAARRRFEPGYRQARPSRPQPPKQLAPGDEPLSLETIANMTPPELREFISSAPDPRTGQPRRRRARGFGRTDNYIPVYAPVALRNIQ